MYDFKSRGYTDPIDLLCGSEMQKIFKNCSSYPENLLPWHKGRHSVQPAICELGSHPRIVKEVSKILGDNIILWSSQIINQHSSINHSWKSEIANWPGVTVWIDTNKIQVKTLKVISGSHRLGISPQKLASKENLDLRDDIQVMQAAKKLNPNCELINIDLANGQFVILNDLMWYAVQKTPKTTSSAIIFQYTTPNYKTFIPQCTLNAVPKFSLLQPDCLLVKGEDSYQLNRIIDSSYAGSWKSILKTFLVHLPNKVRRKIILG